VSFAGNLCKKVSDRQHNETVLGIFDKGITDGKQHESLALGV
jgi:hypothetical protein